MSQLCGVAVIIAESAAQPTLPTNSTIAFPFGAARYDQSVVQPLMISFAVVMGKVFADGSSPRVFAEKNHSLQPFLLDRPYETFSECVQVGRSRRKLHGVAVSYTHL